MVKLVRIKKDKRFDKVVEKNTFDAELVTYKGEKAYKFRPNESGPEAFFPVSRLGKVYDVSEIETSETILA